MTEMDETVRGANSGSSDDAPSFSESFWSPADHIDKLHLVASRKGREIEVETKYGPATPAIADVVVVFSDDRKEWDIYKEVRIFPSVLKREVIEGGLLAGPIIKDQTSSGNPVWLFGDLTPEDATFTKEWSSQHLVKNDTDSSYAVVGDTPDSGADMGGAGDAGPDGASAGGAGPDGAGNGLGDSITEDEEPF